VAFEFVPSGWSEKSANLGLTADELRDMEEPFIDYLNENAQLFK
jgi:hypothetical protein